MKSRGLEALERIGKCYVKSESKDLMFTDEYGDDYDIIERELKALEILKNKLVVFKQDDYLMGFKDHFEECEITKEEYNILKEAL